MINIKITDEVKALTKTLLTSMTLIEGLAENSNLLSEEDVEHIRLRTTNELATSGVGVDNLELLLTNGNATEYNKEVGVIAIALFDEACSNFAQASISLARNIEAQSAQ